MQSSKEEQGEIRKPSSVISAKKQENNRMGKTRDLYRKIRDTKGTLLAKLGSIKDRNGMDLTEAEDIKKRCAEYMDHYAKWLICIAVVQSKYYDPHSIMKQLGL